MFEAEMMMVVSEKQHALLKNGTDASATHQSKVANLNEKTRSIALRRRHLRRRVNVVMAPVMFCIWRWSKHKHHHYHHLHRREAQSERKIIIHSGVGVDGFKTDTS